MHSMRNTLLGRWLASLYRRIHHAASPKKKHIDHWRILRAVREKVAERGQILWMGLFPLAAFALQLVAGDKQPRQCVLLSSTEESHAAAPEVRWFLLWLVTTRSPRLEARTWRMVKDSQTLSNRPCP